MVQADNRCVCGIPLSGNNPTQSLFPSYFLLTTFMSCHYFFIHTDASSSVSLAGRDDAARMYYDETPKEERCDTSITAIMRAATKNKQ
jgi:hypothetical protein